MHKLYDAFKLAEITAADTSIQSTLVYALDAAISECGSDKQLSDDLNAVRHIIMNAKNIIIESEL